MDRFIADLCVSTNGRGAEGEDKGKNLREEVVIESYSHQKCCRRLSNYIPPMIGLASGVMYFINAIQSKSLSMRAY